MNTPTMKKVILLMISLLGISSLVIGQGFNNPIVNSDFGSRIKVEHQTQCGYDLFASPNINNTNVQVGSLSYFDNSGGINNEIKLSNTSTSSGSIVLSTIATTTTAFVKNTMTFFGGNNPNGNALRIGHSNNIPLTLKGSGDLTITGSLTQNSDIRLKRDFDELGDVLPTLNDISAYRYNWKNEKRGNKPQLGLIAQEIQKSYPELVVESEDGTLSVAYTNFTAVLLQATKELHEIVEKQGIEIANLKKELAK